jgi:hypothetical protein
MLRYGEHDGSLMSCGFGPIRFFVPLTIKIKIFTPAMSALRTFKSLNFFIVTTPAKIIKFSYYAVTAVGASGGGSGFGL